MGQMGHATPRLALSIYAREMDRRDGEPERLRALVNGRDVPAEDGVWAAYGQASPFPEVPEAAA
jgi:hypothetical protein